MHTVKTVILTSNQQLLDLNGDVTNFKLDFTATSEGDKPFYLLVVDQTTLDNTSELDLKHVTNGTISGNLVADNNVYQNYFLVLRGEPEQGEIKVNVTIDIQEIEPKKQDKNVSFNIEGENTTTSASTSTTTSGTTKFKFVNPFTTCLVVVIIGVLLYLLYIYLQKKKSQRITKPSIISGDLPQFGIESEVLPPVVPVSSPVVEANTPGNYQSIIDALGE